MRRARFLALLLALGALLPAAAPAAAAGHLVRITSTLSPATLIVAPGDRVTWRNGDGERHRIRSQSGPGEFDSGDLEPGQSFTVTLSTTGTYTYLDERDDDDARYWGTVSVSAGGGGPSPTQPGDGAGGGGGGGGGTAQPAPTGASIGMASRTFSPGNVTIALGGTVTWRNDDDREHTASSRTGLFDSGRLSPSETYRRVFPAAGTFPFLCLIHPEMTGTVTVTGGSGAGGGTPAVTPRPAAATPTPTLRALPRPGAAAVTLRDFAFAPPELTVDAGTRVTFANDDIGPHTVTSDGGSFDSGSLEPGEAFSRVFATAGRFGYLCAIHPSMTGVIVVRAAGAPDPTTSAPTGGATPGPSGSTSPPGSSVTGEAAGGGANVGGGGQAGNAGGAAEAGPGAEDAASRSAAASSRAIGTVLLGVALIVGLVLLAGIGLAGVRDRRGNALLP